MSNERSPLVSRAVSRHHAHRPLEEEKPPPEAEEEGDDMEFDSAEVKSSQALAKELVRIMDRVRARSLGWPCLPEPPIRRMHTFVCTPSYAHRRGS